MITFFKKLVRKDKVSTAALVSKQLEKDGVMQGNIAAEHLYPTYESLIEIQSRPDFTSIADVLAEGHEETEHENCPVWGLIVETREHSRLEFVVNNFIKHSQVPIQLFHGKDNLDFIMSTSIASLVQQGKVHLTKLDVGALDASKYNALFLSKLFWKNVLGRKKILVFQTDAVLCEQSDYSINDFLSYDYIGSKWPVERPIGIRIAGGNGGLSLRDWGKTYQCLERFPPKYWCGGEDGYFGFHMELIGGRVGSLDECAKFSTQHSFEYNSWGAHQVSCLSRNEVERFLKYCPDAGFMANSRSS